MKAKIIKVFFIDGEIIELPFPEETPLQIVDLYLNEVFNFDKIDCWSPSSVNAEVIIKEIGAPSI